MKAHIPYCWVFLNCPKLHIVLLYIFVNASTVETRYIEKLYRPAGRRLRRNQLFCLKYMLDPQSNHIELKHTIYFPPYPLIDWAPQNNATSLTMYTTHSHACDTRIWYTLNPVKNNHRNGPASHKNISLWLLCSDYQWLLSICLLPFCALWILARSVSPIYVSTQIFDETEVRTSNPNRVRSS